ncbi:uncharacterized protein LOC134254297, partial [Saccostrea cucullata]|uniref:uncharacterized protein LOC134254297 n=1 Tax=Saccostrea cuccullata TaxID=36930 RepID=UPI002ED4444D
AIYGGPLPAFSLPEPENSFDNNGKYIGQIIIKDSDFVDSPRKDAVRGYNVPDQTSVSTDKMAVPQPTVAPKVKVTYTNEVNVIWYCIMYIYLALLCYYFLKKMPYTCFRF